jgi:hypothetical protein
MRPLQRRQHLRIILVGRAGAEHLQARPDAAVVIRDHAAEMVRDDLQRRMAVEQTAERHAHHRDRCVVRPAEAPPQLVTRLRLGGIIGEVCTARGMQPDRQIEPGHRGEHRLEDGIVERTPGVRGVDPDAAGAQVVHSPARLRDRAFHVLQRHRGDEGRKPLGIFACELRHRVIGDPRERQTKRAVGDVLDWRIGQRDDFAVVAELVHLAKARVEIEQLGHLLQPFAHILEIGRSLGHLLEIALRGRCGRRCR